MEILPVLLCGGSGTRLWPLSRKGLPKQFLSIFDGESLFQLSVKRLIDIGTEEMKVLKPLVVAAEEHRFLVLEQLQGVGIEAEAAVLEPVGKDTAPALTMAALAAQEVVSDPILVVSPADHVIQNQASFVSSLQDAVRAAAEGAIVILGAQADRPETGYGYIQTRGISSSDQTFQVESFIEKPDVRMAQKFLADGEYYWNVGVFVLRASLWLEAIRVLRPMIYEGVKNSWSMRKIDTSFYTKFIRPDQSAFDAIPSESVDHAVMERCIGTKIQLKMVRIDAGWDDLGAWESVWRVSKLNQDGNSQVGDVLLSDSKNNLVRATGRMVALIGVQGLVVIETPDVVMVADKERSQEVKKIVAELASQGREEYAHHRKVHRPWGWYDTIDASDRFKVKRIQLKPGASLSLQKHLHRSEHWVVVKGTAEVTNGTRVERLNENESIYIGAGVIHRLSNPTDSLLEIIEVQTGSYLGEDDIFRYDDEYGR